MMNDKKCSECERLRIELARLRLRLKELEQERFLREVKNGHAADE
jgi:hypothetical protein